MSAHKAQSELTAAVAASSNGTKPVAQEVPCPQSCHTWGIFAPQPAIKPMSPAVDAQNPIHWTSREFSLFL